MVTLTLGLPLGGARMDTEVVVDSGDDRRAQ